ncbi:MAG TPA: hypothetical protein VEX13_16330 [Chloroflexia bacterium]|nr:hypothetical protein [Chloroflexia bacterium]
MVIHSGESNVTQIKDVRRQVALRAYGTVRFLNSVQGGLEDVEGALGAGQYKVAAFQARYVMLACLSIRSLGREGEIDFDEDYSVSFDYFAGLSEDEVAAALSLANEAVELDEATAAGWLERLRAYVAETEGLLGYDAPLAALRSPEGVFALVSLTRRWGPVLDELGLPALLLPSNWVPLDAATR